MQIPRRLALITSSLALAAGTVLTMGLATPASAETSTAAPQTVAMSDWCGGWHRHHCWRRHHHHHCCCHRRWNCGWGGGWGGGWNSNWNSNSNWNDNWNDNGDGDDDWD
jgi:hypothetical protein